MIRKKLIHILVCLQVLLSALEAQECSTDTWNLHLDSSVNCFLDSWWWPWETEKSNEEGKEKENSKVNPFTLESITNLEENLQKKIVGQNQGIKVTVAALESYVYGLHDAHTPLGTLLYVGPTGVGKTELVKELTKLIFGSEHSLIHLNMSEYAHEGGLNRLIGSPRGYIHYEKGGEFTESLKKNPYAIVLLDGIEKASSNILKIFLQLFDEGFIIDSQGTKIDCRNVLFILTSNLEESKILTMHDLGHSDQEILESIQPVLMHHLSPELYNRLTPVIFRGLKRNVIEAVVERMLFQTQEELFVKTGIMIHFEQQVVHFLKEQVTDYRLGAHPFKHLIKQTVRVAIIEAMKKGFLQRGDTAILDYRENHLVIQNLKKEDSFIWFWRDEKEGISPPFKLDDLINLEGKLQQKVLGQPYAIKMTVAALMRYAAGLTNQKSPIGSFLYIGPTGVGKTQLAKELAIELLGNESHLIRLDLSEYSDASSLSRLIGSPPGHLNHREGGQLTEALKRYPYAIVLLDEIEKAHPIVLKTFLQVFDEGRLSDAQGTLIDCRNMVFIATTNIAAAHILKMDQDGVEESKILDNIRTDVMGVLSPELYNRLEVAVFRGLSTELFEQLVVNVLEDFQKELRAKKGINIKFDSSLIDFLKLSGYDYELGARPLKRLIQHTVITVIAKGIIEGDIKAGETIEVYYNGEVKIKKSLY